ncbi:class I SAM-dependent methyltransferase [Clostridium neonatale]|uniref:Arsenite methyltransferase n=1 Tax=Clostridium neonatale TaxID=137838 RepID=A0AA86JPD0_9CLOT|nr:hypothetical protein CNEO_60037 [Clostridium neonatale]
MKDNICYFDESYIFFYTDYLNDNITIEEVKFIKNQINSDSKVLDICCGHGRHTIELSKLGVNIIGIDNSSEAIKLAKKKAVESNLNPNIFQEVDVFQFNTTGQFDCIILECNTLGLFAKKDVDLLIKMKSMLKDNGKIILDVLNKNFLHLIIKNNIGLLKIMI